MSTASVKVAASDLLRKVREAKAERIRQHENARLDFEAARKSSRALVKDLLRRALKLKEPELLLAREYHGGRYTPVIDLGELDDSANLEIPSDPGTLNTDKEDRDIALLVLAGDQKVTVRSDSNWMRYL
jgi:hypothetical protein